MSENDRDADAHLLLVDDDRELGTMLREFLAPDRLVVDACTTGEEGLSVFDERRHDLVILDIMLPGMNGLDALRRLRARSNVPVIMLTARGEDVDRIIGLEFGADDYLAKPFNPRELLARIKAILRRTRFAEPADRLAAASLRLDTKTRKAMCGERPVDLTGTEFEILRCLLETPGTVVSRDRLSETALGRRLLPFDRSIDTHISNLRQKLAAAGAEDVSIGNQRGVGYVLLAGD